MFFKKVIQSTYSLLFKASKKEKPKIILGLSGGPDSIFLFNVLKVLFDQKKIELIVAHFDHEWRVESFRDVEFCRNLANKNNINFVDQKASQTLCNVRYNGSQEEVGRKLRRSFFESVKKDYNADFIALAHHYQDQQETFFIRILRGTSLSGLCCMKEVFGPYVRPLLFVQKQQIMSYLQENNIEYLIDSTNECENYLRNSIRKNLIPTCLKVDSRFNKTFSSMISLLQEEDDFLKNETKKYFSDIFKKDDKQILYGNKKRFTLLDSVIQKRLIIDWLVQESVTFIVGQSFIKEIIRFIYSPRGGKHQIHRCWALCKKGNLFWISQ